LTKAKIFIRDKPIFSLERILYKDYDCKGPVGIKILVASLEGLGAETN
jgi:hypothetical protein